LNDEPFSLLYIREAGVFVPEEQDVDLAVLALSNVAITQKREPFVKGKTYRLTVQYELRITAVHKHCNTFEWPWYCVPLKLD
jgi:hypothetical protein